MLSKVIVTLVIISFIVILVADEDNTLDFSDSKLYFSIDSTINSKYYTKGYTEYTKTLKSYHFKKNEELGYKIPPSYIKISLPDSLVGDNLKIKKGFYATKIDTILSAPFLINNFELDVNPGNDRTIINFTIPDSLSHNKQNLFIVGKNKKTLKEIISFSPEICKKTEINVKITKLINHYFYENREELERQLTYLYPIADSLTDDQLINEISSKFSLMNFKINGRYYLVIGTSKEYEHHKFFAIVFPYEQSVLMKTHTKFYQSFNINNEYYFFCHGYLPFTGGNTFWIYQLKEDRLETIFIDGSFSM